MNVTIVWRSWQLVEEGRGLGERASGLRCDVWFGQRCEAGKQRITTRKRLIAALLTAGEYVLKMPAVRPSRVA
jgi:hypothetical protein